MIQSLEKIEELIVQAGEKITLVETELSPEAKIVVEAGGYLKHYRLHKENAQALEVCLKENATYESVTLHIGNGDLKAVFNLEGEGATCRFDVVYVLTNDEKAVIRSEINHSASETTSSQLIKGAVNGKARAVFEGGIIIPYEQKAINGSQQHRALLLSSDAQITAVPQLEIYADDVKCAHGSAIGTLNEDQLFYLRSRGINEDDARKILTTAFLNEVLETIDDETVQEEFKLLAKKGLNNGL